MIERINVTKKEFDGSIRERYATFLVDETDYEFVCLTPPGMPAFNYRTNEPSSNPDGMLEIYFKNRWFNVCHICESKQPSARVYSNVSLPTVRNPSGLEWVDLQLDVRISPTGAVEAIDEDDFRESSSKLSYPKEVIDQALAAWMELQKLASRGSYPFDRDNQLNRYRGTVSEAV